MYKINKSEVNRHEQYKLLSGAIIPRPIAWITSKNETDNIINLAPFSFFNVAGPGLISVSFLRAKGQQKDTARNIINTKEAVIHVVTKEIEVEMNETAASLPYNQSELDLIQVNLEESIDVNIPSIKEAKVRFEVKLIDNFEIKNSNDKVVSDLLIMEVENYYFDEEILDRNNLYILNEKYNTVSRLAGDNYATLNDIYTIERPN